MMNEQTTTVSWDAIEPDDSVKWRNRAGTATSWGLARYKTASEVHVTIKAGHTTYRYTIPRGRVIEVHKGRAEYDRHGAR